MCQVWLKLAQWILRRRLLNFVYVFLTHLGIYLFTKSRTEAQMSFSNHNLSVVRYRQRRCRRRLRRLRCCKL